VIWSSRGFCYVWHWTTFLWEEWHVFRRELRLLYFLGFWNLDWNETLENHIECVSYIPIFENCFTFPIKFELQIFWNKELLLMSEYLIFNILEKINFLDDWKHKIKFIFGPFLFLFWEYLCDLVDVATVQRPESVIVTMILRARHFIIIYLS
jgi:hypothetical protein